MKRRRVTAQDVADLAGVSRTTVSFVINNVEKANISEATKRKVLNAARELHYIPNAAGQALVSQRTSTIGLVYYDAQALHPFNLQIIKGLTEVTRQENLRLIVDSPLHQKQEGVFLNLVRAKHIDGLVLREPSYDDPELHLLAEEHFPVVLIGVLPTEDICSIDINNTKLSRAMTNHLIGLGHERIACITNAPRTFTASHSRLAGYREALLNAGLDAAPNLVRYGDYTPESGYAAMQDILATVRPAPTAVFVASDTVAFGVMRGIHEAGMRIPDDIAVAGFDDIPMARFAFPPLSSVSFSGVAEGRRAGELLIQLMEGKIEPGYSEESPAGLVIRESTVAGIGERYIEVP